MDNDKRSQSEMERTMRNAKEFLAVANELREARAH